MGKTNEVIHEGKNNANNSVEIIKTNRNTKAILFM